MPTLRNLLASCAAAVGGLLVMLIVVALLGYSPSAVARGFVAAAFGGTDRIAAALLLACPLLLTGLAVCVAFRCGVWNIGAEGQYLVGALAAAWLGAHADGWPKWAAIPVMLVLCMSAGAIWSGLAAWLKIARHVQEVLSTILLNFIAIQVVALCVRGPLTDPESTARETTADIAAAARLPLLSPQYGLHIGILIAIVMAACVWFLLFKTVAGFRIRIVGGNPIAASWAGLPVPKLAFASFLVSGALAGLAGGIEVAGNSYHLTVNYASGYGYTAIAVAMLARLSPFAVVPSAIFFAILDTGIRGLQHVDVPGLESFPTAMTFLAQGVVILMVVLFAGSPKPTGET